MQMQGYQPPPTQADIIRRQQAESLRTADPGAERQRKMREQIDEELAEFRQPRASPPPGSASVAGPVQYKFPSRAHLGTQYYQQAYTLLTDMLAGKQPIHLAKAVHAVENAYVDHLYSYAAFDHAIRNMAQVCRWKLTADGYSPDNQTAKLITIFKFISDTTQVKHPQNGQFITHYPFQYDFEDFSGENDWTKLFVSKLILSKSGQCHSLPLLYLLLTEQLDAKAYLAFSPSHTYIKFQDEKGQ